MDLATFSIQSLIVHDVPRHWKDREEHEPIILSEAPSGLSDAMRNLITERIKRSLGGNSYEVERDPESPSPVPDLVERIARAAEFDADAELISASQEIADHLFRSQTGSNSPGLLIVSSGQADRRAAVSVLKLEREDAVRIRPIIDRGHRTFNVEHLRDLMLGRNTKVFKASLFTSPLIGKLDGLVSDGQRPDPHAEVANFFLQRFLGCRLKLAADIATRRFFEASQEFINLVPDAEKKARYEIALIAAMNVPGRTMSSAAVSQQMDVEDRQSYREFLDAKEVSTPRFDKDTRLIASELRQMVLGFQQSGLRLSGTPADIAEFVRFNEDDAAAPVEIHDQVKNVRGGTR